MIFFSDEAYRWLVKGGEKTKIMYKSLEFEELYAKARALQERLKVSPIDIEKVAYVTIKENEPVAETKTKIPSGRPRGRPRKPDSEKITKKPAVPGRGRGRPKGSTKVPQAPPNSEPKKRGRPPGSTKANKLAATVDGGEPDSPDAKRVKV